LSTNAERYLIMDLRAADIDMVDEALVLDTADGLIEAREAAREQGGGVIWDTKKDQFIEIVGGVESE